MRTGSPCRTFGLAVTVFDDGTADVLTRRRGTDWFLFNVDGDDPTGGEADRMATPRRRRTISARLCWQRSQSHSRVSWAGSRDRRTWTGNGVSVHDDSAAGANDLLVQVAQYALGLR
jgi:hypothetical protein